MPARPALALACFALLLAGCTGDGDEGGAGVAAAAPTSAGPTPTPTPTPPVVVAGGDAALTALVEEVYAGRTGVQGVATVGTWGEEQVAVVTVGDDVTLAVGPSWKVVGGWWPSLGRAQELPTTPRFVLVVGSDARPNQKLAGTRADTIQVLGLDGAGGGGVMGIARDVWAPMPGGGKAKINAAFALGGGPGQLQSVRKVTGLPIEGYVATGFKGFTGIVSGSGGVNMTISKTITTNSAGGLRIAAGTRTLDAKTALAYARERKALPDGDFGRSRHQGDMLVAGAAAARLVGPEILATTMSLVSANAETDLTATEALTFAAGFVRADPAKVGRHVAKGGIGTSADGQSIVVLDGESKNAFARFRDGRL